MVGKLEQVLLRTIVERIAAQTLELKAASADSITDVGHRRVLVLPLEVLLRLF
jgi:hypothetical protein